MKALIPAAIIAIILAWGLAFLDDAAQDARQERNYMQSQRNALALDRERHWNELQEQHAPTIATAQTVLAVGSMAVLLAVFGSLALALYHWAQGVQFDKRYAFRELDAQRQVAVARENNRWPDPPQSVETTHNPTFAPQYRGHTLPGDTAPAVEPVAEPITVPTFADLLTNGLVGQGQPLILGYGSTGAVYGDWKDLYSTGIGGISGSGKSWTAAYLIGQSVLHGANIAILDPHAGDRESLSTRLSPLVGRFLCEPADSPKAMVDVVKMMFSEYERRKQRPKEPRTPWIIACDEFSSLMRGELAEALSLLFEAIAEEGRKFEIYGMALGQVWTASRAGGTEVRDNLASQYVHRLRPAQARHLTGLTAADLPRDLLELPPGTCYLMSTSGEMRRVNIPQCTSGDLATVAGLLSDQAPTMPRVVSLNGHNGASDETDMTPERNQDDTASVSSSQPLTSDEALIAQLFYSEGLEIGEIVERVTGKKLKGAAYQNAARPVQAAIRKAGGYRARAVGE